MNRRKKIIISIIVILFVVAAVSAATYAFLVAVTNEEGVNTGSGMLGIVYGEPADITGNFIPSSDRSGGLMTTATARLESNSQSAILNMYIKPTTLTNLNIEALKWEAEAIRNGVTICSGSGNFVDAQVGTAIKLFVNDPTDNINDCVLTTDTTTFNIYIWLDASILNTSLSGATFGATIGADSVNITGMY